MKIIMRMELEEDGSAYHYTPHTIVTHAIEGEISLAELFSAMKSFALACGFSFDPTLYLDLVEEQ